MFSVVAWSPEGNRLAFSGHDSTVSFVHFFAGEDAEQPTVQTLKLKGLPVNNLLFCNNNKLIAAGHDMTPIIFDANGDTWSQGAIVDKKDGGEKKEKKKETNFSQKNPSCFIFFTCRSISIIVISF